MSNREKSNFSVNHENPNFSEKKNQILMRNQTLVVVSIFVLQISNTFFDVFLYKC